MTFLSAMRDTFYPQFFDQLVSDYARENVSSGRWQQENALIRSQGEITRLLPQGLATPDNYLFEIRTEADGETAGYIWFAVSERQGERSAFIYEVSVFPQFRRQGHARAAFLQLEEKVRGLGLTSVGLNVFYKNSAAQALYSSLGYAPTNLTMVKALSAE
ncbi:GNAT family N-acetyltransferase [Rahnella sp. L72c]|uniref:GNAT family N-acetyltransferase n=1 Tax=Rahnella perminowiae TaxID=2816244 RepID=A0ABS6L2M2_9GAMM|nr:GNAT family N-acetyltransferase [Rahnella perminowiae]MBU9835843.1 GNAT family N-acetyltransferase [Rahnella perminowiae]